MKQMFKAYTRELIRLPCGKKYGRIKTKIYENLSFITHLYQGYNIDLSFTRIDVGLVLLSIIHCVLFSQIRNYIRIEGIQPYQ